MHTTPAVKFKGDYLVVFLPQKGFQNICIAFFMGGKKILVEEKKILVKEIKKWKKIRFDEIWWNLMKSDEIMISSDFIRFHQISSDFIKSYFFIFSFLHQYFFSFTFFFATQINPLQNVFSENKWYTKNILESHILGSNPFHQGHIVGFNTLSSRALPKNVCPCNGLFLCLFVIV